ncbi:omega-amidase, chloroplastic, partial [Tanacetum coccineum]
MRSISLSLLSSSSSLSLSLRSSTAAPPLLRRHFQFQQQTNHRNLVKLNSIRTIMASSFSPEKARVPPAVDLPLPPISKFKIGLCQLSVTADKERNIAHARLAIEEAAEKGAKLVLLPEIWNSPYANESFPVYAEDIDAGVDSSPSTAMLSEVARSLKITIVGGSIPERCGDKLYNTCCVFDTDGKLKAKHRKIHLFDINIPGKITFEESKTLTAGETPTVVDTDVGRIGIGICYDIRFQELAMLYAARGAHLLCYPGAFNMTTGPLHWELLQRARAVDNQLYVATCSPARDAESGGYVAWGHSTLVGPFGEVLATTEHNEATIIAEVDYSLMELR